MMRRAKGEAPVIALLTDFGVRDIYAGVLHAVIARHAPQARVLDLTHGIPPRDVVAGAMALAAATPWLPESTIVVAVVDPGVGSARRALIVNDERVTIVAPDNGLLGLWLRPAGRPVEAVAIDLNAFPEASPTFHGRDIFARVAAQLANGASPGAFGVHTDPADLHALPLPEPVHEKSGVRRGAVLDVDRFGNVITNFSPGHPACEGICPGACVSFRGLSVPVVRTYSDVTRGALLLLEGSAGWYEMSVRDGSAASHTGLGAGDQILFRLQSPG